MPGPPPKDPSQRRRRSPKPGFEQLPPEGRVAPAPEWPFGEPSAAEAAKWEELWRLPQAIKWEQMHCEDIVALYVRTLVQAVVSLDDKLMTQCRQLDRNLGLSPKAMRDLQWEVGTPREPEEDVQIVTKPERVYVPKS